MTLLAALEAAGVPGTVAPGAAAGAADEPVEVAPADWPAAAAVARRRAAWFDHLTGVDETDDPLRPGVDVVLRLWSPEERTAAVLRTRALLPDLALPTLTGVLPGAAWPERELAEMFGVTVTGHPDPRPLLLPPGFGGHPLRKDFVLASRVVRPWPGAPEPGESSAAAHGEEPRSGRSTASRRRAKPLGVPEGWGR